MKAAILVLTMLIMYGCAAESTPPQQQPFTPPSVGPATPAPTEEPAQQEEPPSQEPSDEGGCQTDLQPHQIRDIQISLFDKGIQETEDGFSFRIVPTDEEGNIIPTEGTIAVAVYSSKPDEPLKREYDLYRKSYHIKAEDVLADCGPAPIEILWEDIRASSNMRYMTLPNPGILTVEFTRTGSRELWEAEYKGAEHDVDLVR
jgi:hypothetical protein